MFNLDIFYEYFNIDKVELRIPGRTYDEDGEVCEWYIEEVYPDIAPVFFDLLYFYNDINDEFLKIEGFVDEQILCNKLAEALYNLIFQLESEGKDVSEEKEEVKEIFDDLNRIYIEEELN